MKLKYKREKYDISSVELELTWNEWVTIQVALVDAKNEYERIKYSKIYKQLKTEVDDILKKIESEKIKNEKNI